MDGLLQLVRRQEEGPIDKRVDELLNDTKTTVVRATRDEGVGRASAADQALNALNLVEGFGELLTRNAV